MQGADATSEAHADGRGATLTAAHAFATGGGGGRVDPEGGDDDDAIGAHGGDAHASAFAEGEGRGPVNAFAQAIGGQGGASGHGLPGEPGAGTASALGRSLGGGLVEVQTVLYGGAAGITYGGYGGDAALVDSASGATSGLLRLGQGVIGGEGIGGGPGGSATSALHGENPGGGALEVYSSAASGAGGGDATASATALGNGSLPVAVRASALALDGGTPRLGEVFARSPGAGSVTVIGHATEGSSAAGPGPSPVEVVLQNAVDGDTAGDLLLWQSASSTRGHAESRIDQAHGGSSLVLVSQADGKDAFASATGTSGGAVQLAVEARSLAGGNARTGGVRSVVHRPRARAGSTCRSGDPGSLSSMSFGARGGSGPSGAGCGSGTSRSVGEHLGDGVVIVVDQAWGGSALGAGVRRGLRVGPRRTLRTPAARR